MYQRQKGNQNLQDKSRAKNVCTRKENAWSVRVSVTPSLCQSMAIYLQLHTNTDNKLHGVQSGLLCCLYLSTSSWTFSRQWREVNGMK
jgi:hypothetical protein